jgi:transposase
MSEGKRRKYDGKFKERAVVLAKERQNVAQAARELGVGSSLLRTWITAAESAESKGMGLAQALEERREMERLRKRLAEAEEELEIIKKATAYFAQDRLKRNTPGSKK